MTATHSIPISVSTMVAVDGIEVYLKPATDGGDNSRFLEMEVPPQDDYNEAYKCCFVPFSEEPFQIVVRFAEDYDMFTASAIHIGIGVARWQYRKPDPDETRLVEFTGDDAQTFGQFVDINSKGGLPEKLWGYKVVQRSFVAGQQQCYTKCSSKLLKTTRVNEQEFSMGAFALNASCKNEANC